MLLVSCHWSSNEGLWTFYPYGRLFDPHMRCLEFTIGFIHFSYIKNMITHISRMVGRRKMTDPSFCPENRHFYRRFSKWPLLIHSFESNIRHGSRSDVNLVDISLKKFCSLLFMLFWDTFNANVLVFGYIFQKS